MRSPEPWTRGPRKRWIRIALGILAVVLAAELVLAWRTLARAGWTLPDRFAPEFLGLGLGLALLPWFAHAFRLRLWSPCFGRRLSFAEAFRITLAGDVGNALTPTAVGGGAVKLVLLRERGLPSARAAGLLLLLTAEDAVFFAVSLPVVWSLSRERAGGAVESMLGDAAGRAGLVLAGALLLGLLSTRVWNALARREGTPADPAGTLRGRLAAGWRDLQLVLAGVVRRGKLRGLGSLGLTALQWTSRYTVAAAVLAAFRIEVFPPLHLLLQWAVFTAGTAVPTPGGATAVESAFALIYQPFVPEPLLAPVTAVWRVLLFYVVTGLAALVLGLSSLRRLQGIRRAWNWNPASTLAENEVRSSPGT